jgi:membrane associated rhomboid family serine protease
MNGFHQRTPTWFSPSRFSPSISRPIIMANYYYQTNYGGGLGRFSLFSPVIKTLLISNVVIYLLQHWFLGLLTVGGVPMEAYIMRYFALQPIGSDAFYPWQLITYQFMHGGFLHLLFNMFALWMFGSELESIWGGRRFLTFYFLSGMGAGLLQLLVSYLLGSGAPTVGASGSINGVMLAFGFMFPDRPILMFPIFFPIPAKFFVLFWLAIDLISGVTGADRGVAHFAHLGGALVGYLLLRFGDDMGIFTGIDRVVDTLTGRRNLVQPRRKIYDINATSSYNRYGDDETDTPTRSSPTSWLRRDNTASRTDREITQEEVDRILDKIAHSGYNSLSNEEKRILNEASRKL